mmetsp:Transcript_92261/g.148955  ORF Transcript_92261/g.148955 Transcript_92261/m.148955 type:complete len:201 (-) Transcript_92261:118-720(-)
MIDAHLAEPLVFFSITGPSSAPEPDFFEPLDVPSSFFCACSATFFSFSLALIVFSVIWPSSSGSEPSSLDESSADTELSCARLPLIMILLRSSHGEGRRAISVSESCSSSSLSPNISVQCWYIRSWKRPEQCISILRITGKGLLAGGEKAESLIAWITSRKKILVQRVCPWVIIGSSPELPCGMSLLPSQQSSSIHLHPR